MKNLYEKLMECNALFVGFVVSVLAAIPTLTIAKILMILDPKIFVGQAIAIGLLLFVLAIFIFSMVGFFVKEAYKHR